MSSSPTPELEPDFGRRASTYDDLRPGIPGLDDAVAKACDVRGRRVLDVGCGTGRFAEALATRYGARVFGLDSEPEMLAVARRRGARGVAFKHGRAEALPFKDGWFERATMILVCHLVDRRRAFLELRRVLGSAGRLAIATFDRGYFARYYLCRLFPSLLEIDLARFPPAELLRAELESAGFESVCVEPFVHGAAIGRAEALARIRGRHISTFDLIGEEEYRRGLARAERELPEEIRYRAELLVVTAE